MSDKIGDIAGVLWRYLDDHGAETVTKIAKETAIDSKEIQRAVGWLAKEDKVMITPRGRSELIALKSL